MHIVSDRGLDMIESYARKLGIILAPLLITIGGKTYHGGEDITPEEFYKIMEESGEFPVTAQPSIGSIAEIYRELAKTDPDILSIHISSGLSGTGNAARLAAQQVPEANITIIDTLSLSGEMGWQVEAAARCLNAGWPIEKILEKVEQVRADAEAIYTVTTLRYLIHGGRVSHMKGLLASILNIRPVIGVDKVTGKYEQLGQARTQKGAPQKMADVAAEKHAPGTKLRAQIFHVNNPEGVAQLQQLLSDRFPCHWEETGPLSPALGAHAGPGMVTLTYGAYSVYADLPEA